jgi:hypothetical protein
MPHHGVSDHARAVLRHMHLNRSGRRPSKYPLNIRSCRHPLCTSGAAEAFTEKVNGHTTFPGQVGQIVGHSTWVAPQPCPGGGGGPAKSLKTTQGRSKRKGCDGYPDNPLSLHVEYDMSQAEGYRVVGIRHHLLASATVTKLGRTCT